MAKTVITITSKSIENSRLLKAKRWFLLAHQIPKDIETGLNIYATFEDWLSAWVWSKVVDSIKHGKSLEDSKLENLDDIIE